MAKKDNETNYYVAEKTYSFRECTNCNGSGKKTQSRGGIKYVSNCPHCLGEGRIKITHTTEVSLIHALKALKLIK